MSTLENAWCCWCGYLVTDTNHDKEGDCTPKLRAQLHEARDLAWRGWSLLQKQTELIDTYEKSL